MRKNNTILVAPLNWGLGHATRCIPIIRALLEYNYNVLIASDGEALKVLQKEFPLLESLNLPSYNITYPKKGSHFKWKMFLKLPRIQKAIAAEKRIVKNLVDSGKINGIISDNRFGVRNAGIPSVFITHQLNVLSGGTSYLSSKIHQKIIKKFDVCWVPDVDDLIMNLSGKLGHLKHHPFPIKYIGISSRMMKNELPKTTDVLVLISGPEPQRSIFEEKLKQTFKKTEKNVLMVRGVIENEQVWQDFENIKTVNFMMSNELEDAINSSKLVISRSGYTTLMDLTVLEKKAYFIPTPGQYEQKYLANRLKNLGIAPSCKQKNFSLDKLDAVENYKGLEQIVQQPINYSELFSLFERK